MRFGSLFAGIGGFDLGLERAGMECAWQVEIDPFCLKVLEKHWPDVRRYTDVRKVHGDAPNAEYDGCDGSSLRYRLQEGKGERGVFQSERHNAPDYVCPGCLPTVDLVCGGFPCQPFSVAGKQRGKEDDRHLWPEMFRIVSELRPTWVVGENVPGLVRLGLDEVLSDLEGIGYSTQTFDIPACAVDAPHVRHRIWIVAHSARGRSGGARRIQGCGEDQRTMEEASSSSLPTGEDVAHAVRIGSEAGISRQVEGHEGNAGIVDNGCGEGSGDGEWFAQSRLGLLADGLSPWIPEPVGVPRVSTGVKDRVNKLRALGNSVVPQVVEIIGRAIMECNRSRR